MDLFEHSIDIASVGFPSSSSSLSSILPFASLSTFLRTGSFRWARLPGTRFLWTSSHVGLDSRISVTLLDDRMNEMMSSRENVARIYTLGAFEKWIEKWIEKWKIFERYRSIKN